MTVRPLEPDIPCPYEVGTWLKTPMGDIGYVNQVLGQYFTLCVREWKDSGKMNGISQCILLVFPMFYGKCEILTEGDFERIKDT